MGLALWLVLACGGAQKTESAARCTSNGDCAMNEVCNLRGYCQERTGCRADSDCAAPNEMCDADAGLCLCLNDTACGAGRFCNPSRRCQDVAACSDNTDCQMGTFCDLGTKKCIASGSCGTDTQCPLGQLCDAAQSKCVAGCKTSGDCPQTTVTAGVTVFAPQGCVGGMCQAGKCSSASGCFFEQVCTNSSCVSACGTTTPYCRACDRQNPCGGTKNFCLVDPRNGSNCGGANPPPSCKFWCGIDCSAGQVCPSGFSCYPIVTVVPSLSCTCNTTCSNGTGACLCNEGATTGFCACRMNNDCGPGLQCDQGSCLLGKNCFPSKGLYCDAPGPQCP